MIKRSEIVSATNISSLQAVVLGSKYEELVDDLLGVNIQQPVYADIQQTVLEFFDKHQTGEVSVSQNIVSGGSLTLN